MISGLTITWLHTQL